MKKLVLFSIIALASFTLNASNKAEAKPEAKADAKTETNVEITHSINGLVVDNATNETLAGAVIMVNGEAVYTDLDGNFVLTNIKPGKNIITVHMISYAEQTIEVDANDVSRLDVKLKQI